MRVELLSESENEAGGYKEVVIAVKGGEPYRFFKYESGVHRVQRVPVTEAAGSRAHLDRDGRGAARSRRRRRRRADQSERPGDRHLQVVRRRRPTRQQDRVGDSHHARAVGDHRLVLGRTFAAAEPRRVRWTMLRAQLAERKRREAEEAVGSLRRSQVGTGDRSEKIRTYNYPQDRITDHRINQNFQNIKAILDGDMERLVTELQTRRTRASARRRNFGGMTLRRGAAGNRPAARCRRRQRPT